MDFFKNQPMDFAPGEEFRYNNSAYFLLGYIVELLTEMSYADYIDSTFFQPLGMTNSYYGSTSRIIPNRAGGYAMEGVYVYFIQYSDYTGLTKTLTGNVSVIYPTRN